MSLPHQRALVCNDRAFSNSPFFVQNPLTSRKNSARIVKLAFEEKRKIMNWNEYTLGVRRGMPVGMGYLSVSFGFGTLAAAQGIREGDILLAIDGQSVSTTEEVAAIRDTRGVGDSLRFTIWRQGETFEVDVRLMDTNDIY